MYEKKYVWIKDEELLNVISQYNMKSSESWVKRKMQSNREKAATLMQPASSPEAMVESVKLIILLTASLYDTMPNHKMFNIWAIDMH